LSAVWLTYKRYFLFTRAIEPRKNVRRVTAVHRAFRKTTDCDWPLVFVGGPSWNSAAEHADIRELEGRGYAKYFGHVSASVLPLLYSGANALVFRSSYEEFGLPALEAQKSGIPVIISAKSSMAEFTSESDWLVEPADTSGIRDAMIECYKSRNRRDFQPEGVTGRALTWHDSAAKTLAVYEQVLSAS